MRTIKANRRFKLHKEGYVVDKYTQKITGSRTVLETNAKTMRISAL